MIDGVSVSRPSGFFLLTMGSFLGLRVSAVRIVSTTRILVEFGGLRLARVWRRHFVLGGEARIWFPLQIVDDRIDDGFPLRNRRKFGGGCLRILFAHGVDPFCLRF